MDIYQHRRHNKNLLMVHLIFVILPCQNNITGKSMFYGQTAILQRLLAPYHKQLSNGILKTKDNIS